MLSIPDSSRFSILDSNRLSIGDSSRLRKPYAAASRNRS